MLTKVQEHAQMQDNKIWKLVLFYVAKLEKKQNQQQLCSWNGIIFQLNCIGGASGSADASRLQQFPIQP